MATTYTDVANQQNDPRMGNRPNGVQIGGTLHCSDVLYTIVGTEAANDVINLVRLPAGARVITALCAGEAEDPGTAFTLKIGDDDTTADDDRYTASQSYALGGGFLLHAGSFGVAELNPHTLQSQSWIQATVTTATSLTAGQTIRFVIVWSSSN